MRNRDGSVGPHPPWRLLAGVAVAVFLFWVAFTAGLKPHELLVGLGTTAATVILFAGLLRKEPLHFRLTGKDLLEAWRLPVAIAKDCWILTVVLFRDLFGAQQAGSYYRTCGFRTGKKDPLLVGRSALAMVYTTMSPNMLVIGIDPEQSLMLFHQLKRDAVPAYTQALGASAGSVAGELDVPDGSIR